MKPRMLFLIHLPPPYIGPSIINQEFIQSPLVREHFMPDILSINTSSRLEDVEKFSLLKLFVLCRRLFALFRRLISGRYALAYVSLSPIGIGFFKDAALVTLLKLFRIKILYHLHGKGMSLAHNPVTKALYTFCFAHSGVVLLSSLLIDDIKKYGNTSRLYVLPNGIHQRVSDGEFKEAMKQRKEYQGPVRLLFLSNMVKSKGVFTVLEAARVLRDRGCAYTVAFAGRWYDITEQEFNARVKGSDLGGVIRYLGFKEERDKYALLCNADVFILPTVKDTFPLALLEAMQCGLPSVSTQEGAIPEIIDDGITGFVVPKNDTGALADKIELLSLNPQLRVQMGEAARKKFLGKYRFEQFEARLIDILQKEINDVRH